MTAVVVERGGTVLGVIGILDQLKPEAAETIAELERHRIGTLLLTGDNTRTAHAIASEAGSPMCARSRNQRTRRRRSSRSAGTAASR